MPNSERGPRYLNFDFNMSKAYLLPPRARQFDVRHQRQRLRKLTNAFNHVHLGTPSGVMTSPNFRRITSATDPREIEVGIRFQF